MPKRAPNQMRPVSMTPHYLAHPEGSVLVAFGDTRVICTASVEERVPGWMVGRGRGWVTGEYDMLPRATTTRRERDASRGRINGRTQEISRLVGRALRAVVALDKLGERTITVDCDVIQADGGTRTAAITGGFVALALAVETLRQSQKINGVVLKQHVAAVSAGILDGEAVLDLDYGMDSRAEVDMNVVMTEEGELAEVQGTGENRTFRRDQLNHMLDLAFGALPELVALQRRAIETPLQAELVTVTA